MTRRRNQSRQISVLPARIEPAIPPNERRQTQALDHETAGNGRKITSMNILQSDKMRSDKCGWVSAVGDCPSGHGTCLLQNRGGKVHRECFFDGI
jgi:hypothetical protein